MTHFLHAALTCQRCRHGWTINYRITSPGLTLGVVGKLIGAIRCPMCHDFNATVTVMRFANSPNANAEQEQPT